MAKEPQNKRTEQTNKQTKTAPKKDLGKNNKKDSAKVSGKNAKKSKKPSVFSRIKSYFHNVRLEIKRSTWPTRHEVLNMSIIVVVALLFFGVLIFIIDQIMVMLLGLYGQIAPDTTAAGQAANAAAEAAADIANDASADVATDVSSSTAASTTDASDSATAEAGINLSVINGLRDFVSMMGGR
jgi:preprotein translocase subunit SecE